MEKNKIPTAEKLFNKYNMKKIFNVDGDLVIRFAKTDTEGINKWLAESGIDIDIDINFEKFNYFLKI